MLRLIAVGLLFSLAAHAGYTDTITDDYRESQEFGIHSQGLLSYGAQSNTAHVRKLFARANYQKNNLQLFLTLNAYRDTHDPNQDYTFILNNISLNDYGFTYQADNGLFFSGRGAATYRQNQDTFLLFSPHVYYQNPGETDELPAYFHVYRTGPGVRVGYRQDNFEVAYSQGDFRHSIPTAVMSKVNFGPDYLRLVIFSEYENPLVFQRDTLRRQAQLSYAGVRPLAGPVDFGYLAEVTYHQDGKWWYRMEEALRYEGFTLGVRQLWSPTEPLLHELGLKKEIEKLISVGVHYASVGRFYLAAQIDF